MSEIRPIRIDEADQFLELMCDAFGLDFAGARTLFYADPYYDLSRKWTLVDGDRLVSALTVTPLSFGWGEAIGIAGVCTDERERRQGHAGALIRGVLDKIGGPAMLFARDPSLYATLGFESVDKTIRAEVCTTGVAPIAAPLEFEEVRAIYDRWAESDPSRLMRDELRWTNWKWHYRTCEPFAGGYLAAEPGYLREAILTEPVAALDLPADASWVGLSLVAEAIGLPIREATPDMHVMTRGFPMAPALFLTDQF